jgi:hypothetical protein
LPVTVAAVPELGQVRASFGEYLESHAPPGNDQQTYLPQGVSPDVVASLFARARALFVQKPWELTDDNDLLLVDVPDLGVRGGVLSIVGALGESLGFVLFESLAAFDAFVAAGERQVGRLADVDVDLGGQLFSVTFEPAAGLTPGMRREIAEHGWPVARPAGHPLVLRAERDGSHLPPSGRDVRLAEALCGALAAFVARHRTELGQSTGLITEESQSDGGPSVFLTYPHPDTVELDEPPAPVTRPPAIGRNEPCPCGSGKKYKRCCLARDEAKAAPVPASPQRDLDLALIEEMVRFGRARFPDGWARAQEDFGLELDDRMQLQLFVPWSVYEHRIAGGAPVVDHFLRARGQSLRDEERAWLGKMQQAWLGVWEVEEVRPGEGLTAVDLLTGVRRVVKEKRGSQDLRPRLALLARVAEQDGEFRLFGMYPAPLPPLEAAAVIEEVADRLGLDPPGLSAETLRASDYHGLIVRTWRAAAKALAERPPPTLCNTDGDPLVFCDDELAFDGAQRASLLSSLQAARFRPDPDDGPVARFSWSKRKRGQPEDVLAGSIRIERARLLTHTNSRKRATALRKKLEHAAPGVLTHVRRTETNPRAPVDQEPGPPPEVPAEAREAMRALKAAHYRRWMDESIPALQGRTPRAAVATPQGRRQVDLLLKEAEYLESRLDPAERFDFRLLRQALGV